MKNGGGGGKIKKYYFNDIAELLNRNGFEMIYFIMSSIKQSDSFWIKNELMK